MRAMKSIVILISGRGSNMQAIVQAARKGNWPVRIAAIISNRPDAPGLAFARQHQIPAVTVPSKNYPDRNSFDRALKHEIDQFSPDFVVLAGFMRILTAEFVAHYAGRMFNIHPSLLPSFPGLHTHRQALEAGVKLHGATVHFVTAELDHGPIVAQEAVPVLPDDTEETLAARVLEVEHRLYPAAVLDAVEGRLSISNGCVRIAPKLENHLTLKESA
jgi:phosphoribosylglycinamide formyltransferase-1